MFKISNGGQKQLYETLKVCIQTTTRILRFLGFEIITE